MARRQICDKKVGRPLWAERLSAQTSSLLNGRVVATPGAGQYDRTALDRPDTHLRVCRLGRVEWTVVGTFGPAPLTG